MVLASGHKMQCRHVVRLVDNHKLDLLTKYRHELSCLGSVVGKDQEQRRFVGKLAEKNSDIPSFGWVLSF